LSIRCTCARPYRRCQQRLQCLTRLRAAQKPSGLDLPGRQPQFAAQRRDQRVRFCGAQVDAGARDQRCRMVEKIGAGEPGFVTRDLHGGTRRRVHRRQAALTRRSHTGPSAMSIMIAGPPRSGYGSALLPVRRTRRSGCPLHRPRSARRSVARCAVPAQPPRAPPRRWPVGQRTAARWRRRSGHGPVRCPGAQIRRECAAPAGGGTGTGVCGLRVAGRGAHTGGTVLRTSAGRACRGCCRRRRRRTRRSGRGC